MSFVASAVPDPAPRPRGKPWSVIEFAKHLSCTPKHVRFLLDTGKVGCIRLGKRRRMIPDAEVRRVELEGI